MYVTREGRPAARNGCVIFLRGELGSQSEFERRVQASEIGKDLLWTASRLSILRDGWPNERGNEEGEARRGRIAIVSTPLVYVEFAIRYDSSADPNQFTIKPIFFDYRATAAEREGSGIKDLLFSVRFERNDEGSTPIIFANYDIALPQTPVGARYEREALADLIGRPQNLPGYESKQVSTPGVVPVYVTVSMLEFEKAGDLERIVTEAADENKEKVGATLNERVQQFLAPKPQK
jgi:hypothetical protein